MANQEHLDIFERRVEEWNLWRKKHPEVRPDLSHASLHLGSNRHSDADLSHADLSGAWINCAVLRRADLSGANLSGAGLRDADLSHADLSDVTLEKANLSHANLTGALQLHFQSEQE